MVENSRKRKLTLTSLESLSSTTPEYWQEKTKMHKLKHEQSLLELRKEEVKVETGEDGDQKARFEKFQTKKLQEANVEAKKAAEAAEQYLAMSESALLYTKKSLDDRTSKVNLTKDTTSFISLIMDRIMKRESGGKRADVDQADFKTGLCDHYDALQVPLQPFSKIKEKPYQFQNVWCPALHIYLPYEEVRAAHIVPRFLGPNTMSAIFGAGHGIWTMDNGLLLTSIIETLFDEGHITIVPVSDDEGETELKIRVLEWNQAFLAKKIQIPGIDLRYKDLHDRPLVFKGDKRPKKRYLYFMYVMALKRCDETYREEGRRKEMERSRRVFASLTHSLRASMVPAFAAQLGHDLAPIYEDQIVAAEEDLAERNPKELINEYVDCLDEIKDEMSRM